MLIEKGRYHNLNDVKLNLGSSNRPVEGFLNVDILPLSGVDIVCDLNEGIPLKDNSVTEIYASHVLEHLKDTTKIMEEIYRVCKNDSLITIRVPYFKSIGAFKDPTHKTFFTEETFYYFNKDKKIKYNLPNYEARADFEIVKISYLWSSRWLRYLPFKRRFFIKYFWNIVRTLHIELRVKK